jgi:hypothetical protein
MEKRNGKRFSGILVLVLMAAMLMATVAFAPVTVDRINRGVGGVIAWLKERPAPRSESEAKERWRLTRPGTALPKELAPKEDAAETAARKADPAVPGQNR